jgi:CheY-like chemotaxis protein
VFEDVLRFIRATIPTTIDIRHEMLTKEDTICSDPTIIHQVLMNLCSNAAHAMEQTGGAIVIRMQNIFLDAGMPDIPPGLASGKYIQLMVTDTGPGIDPAIINRIFDPYFTTKEIGKGTGMGLAVVQGIVNSHNGAVAVTNRPGRGATFTVYLPLTDAPPVEETWKPKILELGDETILFVDDEKSIVDMCSKMLTRLGYRVETAMTPLAALDKFQSNPKHFHLVITDMTMPQMTGLQLTKRIKAVNPKMPVVLCTGFSAYITPENAQAMDIQGYLMKPIVKLEMARTVRQVLDSAHQCKNSSRSR